VQSITELPFIAGHVTLDFVNTAEERGHPDAADALRTPADLQLWGNRYGLLAGSAADGDDHAELRRAIDARELLYRLFLARASGQRPVRADLDRLAALAATAYRAGHLEPTSNGQVRWRWNPSQLSTIRHTVVTAAVDLLTDMPSARLKRCPGAHCGWFFLDTTKRGNRRWCSMNECGQDAKTARRRARPRQPISHPRHEENSDTPRFSLLSAVETEPRIHSGYP
jgi:predicted RNA-binding Zn ribbon-like protein